MAFPSTIDTPYNIDGLTQYMDDPGIEGDTVVNTLSSQIVALETKLGINGSSINTTIDYKLSGVATGDKAMSLTGVESASNKTFTSTTLVSPTLTTPVVGSGGATFTGSSSGTTVVKASAAASGTLTLPAATDTLVGKATTDTLTNKTMSTGSSLDGSANENFSFYSLSSQALVNSNMDVWQEFPAGTITTPNDDTYGPDFWNLLVEANGSWTFTRDTDVPSTKSKYSLKCTNVTLNNQCAIVQFIENIDTGKLFGRNVSLSFAAKTSGTEIANLRATILAWSSTADAITSDVIGTWASDGTDPTFAANWTKEASGVNLPLTSSWQTFKMENIALDTASTANLAVIIWVDDGTIAANDDFWVTQAQLNPGAVALQYQPKSFNEELISCQRWWEKSYNYSVAPGANTFIGAAFISGSTNASGDMFFSVPFKVRKRTTPTVIPYRNSGTVNIWEYARNGASGTVTVADGGNTGEGSLGLFGAALGVAWVVATLSGQWTVNARL